MITRDTAANIRYDILVNKFQAFRVACDYDITVSALNRVVDGSLVPVADTRVVVQPNYTPRHRKLTPEQRVVIAHLICYGATLQGLANTYDVQVRTIQHIKDEYTARVGDATANSKPDQGELGHNLVAESRYQYTVMHEPIALIAARLFINYKNIYRAIKGKTFKTSHGRVLTVQGNTLDPESPPGRAVWLYLLGADVGFISDSTDIDQETVRGLIDAYTEPRK
jgi:hypothetical protein